MLEKRILVHFADICLHISSTTEQIEMIFKKKSFIDLITLLPSTHTYRNTEHTSLNTEHTSLNAEHTSVSLYTCL